jgi:hypothetical protein
MSSLVNGQSLVSLVQTTLVGLRTIGMQSQVWCKRVINHSRSLDFYPTVARFMLLIPPYLYYQFLNRGKCINDEDLIGASD